MCNIKYFGNLTTMYRICPLFFYTSSIRHDGFHRNTFEYYSAWNVPSNLKLASITLSCFLYLQHNLWLKMVSFVVAEISSSQMYWLFSHTYILWHKYHQTPITFIMVVLFSKWPLPLVGLNIISIFKFRHHYRS